MTFVAQVRLRRRRSDKDGTLSLSLRQCLQLLAVLFEVFLLRAADPVFAADATVKVFELCISLLDVCFCPQGCLAESVDARPGQHLFQHRGDCVNQFEVSVAG